MLYISFGYVVSEVVRGHIRPAWVEYGQGLESKTLSRGVIALRAVRGLFSSMAGVTIFMVVESVHEHLLTQPAIVARMNRLWGARRYCSMPVTVCTRHCMCVSKYGCFVQYVMKYDVLVWLMRCDVLTAAMWWLNCVIDVWLARSKMGTKLEIQICCTLLLLLPWLLLIVSQSLLTITAKIRDQDQESIRYSVLHLPLANTNGMGLLTAIGGVCLMGPRRRRRGRLITTAVRLTVASMARRRSGGIFDAAMATARDTAPGITRDYVAKEVGGQPYTNEKNSTHWGVEESPALNIIDPSLYPAQPVG